MPSTLDVTKRVPNIFNIFKNISKIGPVCIVYASENQPFKEMKITVFANC